MRIAEALQIDLKMLEEDPGMFPTPPARPSDAGIESQVRKSRKSHGWSHGKLTARTGKSVRRIASIESGREWATLEKALGCDVGDLFSRKERESIKGAKAAEAIARLVGKRFGCLTVRQVLALSDTFKKGRYVICQCDCGTLCHARVDALKSGHSTSCGCRSGKRSKSRIR